MNLLCADFIVPLSYNICLQEKNCSIIPIYFLQMTIKRYYISILKVNIVEEASLEFRLRKIDETRNYLLDEIKHNNLMSEEYKKTCKYLNYVEHLFILVSTVIGCVSISAFDLLVSVPVGITSSAVGIKTYAITARIKKYKSVIKKKKTRR